VVTVAIIVSLIGPRCGPRPLRWCNASATRIDAS
jgi:hypothetical protein